MRGAGRAEPDPAAAHDCVDLTFEQGATGTYTRASESDDHVKHHFSMPADKDILLVEASWADQAWAFEVALGTGHCPHSGHSLLTQEGTGEVELRLEAAQAGEGLAAFTADEQWFVHLGVSNEQADGATAEYTLAAQACSSTAPQPEPQTKGATQVPPTEKTTDRKAPAPKLAPAKGKASKARH